jgi:predicted component of type VI protein secretion system
MKKLLAWLTLLTTGAVVVLLVVYLVPTALALFRADRNLAKLIGELEAVRDNTAPLSQDLTAINEATAALRGHLIAADVKLHAAIQSLRGNA